ncbi:MAG: hypothetical protein ACKVII_02760 [Planctomycetales bacterium]
MQLFSYRDSASILTTRRYNRVMGNFDWQLTAVLICVAAAMWSMVGRFRNLMAGKGGCGDCSKAKPAADESNDPKLVTEDQIEMLYEKQ